MIDRSLWSACDRLASLPVFPALVICAALAAAILVGVLEKPI